MTRSEVQQAIREFVTTELAKPPHEPIHDHDDITAEGVIDSLGIMDLIGFLESAFAIRVRDEDILPENFSSIAAIAAYVSRASPLPREPDAPGPSRQADAARLAEPA